MAEYSKVLDDMEKNPEDYPNKEQVRREIAELKYELTYAAQTSAQELDWSTHQYIWGKQIIESHE